MFIDQKGIQDVYKAKTAKKTKKQGQTKNYWPPKQVIKSGKYSQLKKLHIKGCLIA